MKPRARHLAAIIVLALMLRAGLGIGADPYAPQYQPSPPGNQPTAPNQLLRYPLPSLPNAGPMTPGPGLVPAAAPSAPAPGADLFQPGVIVAQVGDKAIFYGDVAPVVNLIVEPYLAKAKSDEERQQIKEQLEREREAIMKNVVKQMVQTKLLYHEFDRGMRKKIGTDAKKFAEAKGGMEKRIRSFFEKALLECREKMRTATPEQVQKLAGQDPTIGKLALLMHERNLESFGELDLALKQLGTSLDQQINAFGEHQLGMQAVRDAVPAEYEVTHEEMLDYYREHTADYGVQAKARFEILTAKFANFPSRREALDHIAQMGNAVYLGGTPFDAVARKFSQEPNASSGGYYDWINQGSLSSKIIDQAIFTLEPNKLSQIIEDETGYHIIRVKAREPAGLVSFLEAQPEIKEAIKTKKRLAKQQEYLEELQAKTTVWTIFSEASVAAGKSNSQQR